MHGLLQRCAECIHAYNAAQLACALWAVATLGYRPSRRWLQAITAAASQRLPELRSRELANVLWALAELGVHPGRRVLRQVLVASEPMLPRARPEELLQLLAALAKLAGTSGTGSSDGLQQRPGDCLPGGWCSAFVDSTQVQLGSLRSSELAGLLWSLSRLQPCCRLRCMAVSSGLVSAAASRLQGRLAALGPGGLMMALCGLAGELGTEVL
jgi:hypothetical protein